MSVKRFAAGLTALFVAASAATVSAQEEQGRSGPYVGVAGSYAFENFDSGLNADDSWGYDIKAGYRFNPYFALEAEWQHFVDFEAPGDDFNMWMIGANGKIFILPGPIQPYLLAGLGWVGGKVPTKVVGENDSDDDFGARFAGGLDFYLSRNVVLYAEAGYVLPFGNMEDLGAIPVSFGFMWRFY